VASDLAFAKFYGAKIPSCQIKAVSIKLHNTVAPIKRFRRGSLESNIPMSPTTKTTKRTVAAIFNATDMGKHPLRSLPPDPDNLLGLYSH